MTPVLAVPVKNIRSAAAKTLRTLHYAYPNLNQATFLDII